MVLYLDLAFALNMISDLLALYVTARLSGRGLRWRRLILVALCGGVYGVLSAFPSARLLNSFAVQIIVAVCMVWFAFRTKEMFLRLLLLYFVLSCTIGGAFIAFSQLTSEYGLKDLPGKLDWNVFAVVGVFMWFVLSVIFDGAAQHMVKGQIYKVSIEKDGRIVRFNALLDTGHTLRDPISGDPVMTVWCESLCELWTDDEKADLSRLEKEGTIFCDSVLSMVSQEKFYLLPYRAVGVKEGYLICFKPDAVMINDESSGRIVVALSPTPISDGSGYTALWGGERRVHV